MPQATRRWISEKVKSLRESNVLPFHDILDAQMVASALAEEGVRFNACLYTPLVTLCVFLSQVLDPDHSCRAAVAQLIVWLAITRRMPCAPETNSYCEARQRLPLGVVVRLVRQTAREIEGRAPEAWLWRGRRVALVDGTTASMPDSEENQKAYPQSLAGHRGRARPGARSVPGEGDGRDGAVPHALEGPRAGRGRAGGPVFCLVLRDRGAVATGRRRPVPHAPAAEVRLPSGLWLAIEDHVVVWTKPAWPEWMDE